MQRTGGFFVSQNKERVPPICGPDQWNVLLHEMKTKELHIITLPLATSWTIQQMPSWFKSQKVLRRFPQVEANCHKRPQEIDGDKGMRRWIQT